MSVSLDNAFFLAALLTDVAVIGLLFYRRIWRTLPIFCAYAIWDLASNLATYAISQYAPHISFHAYFAQELLDSALIFCVLVELAWSVLRPVRASLPRGALVVVAAAILIAGAVIWPFSALPGLAHATTREGLLYTELLETTSILRVLFFLLLASGSQLLSIGWRDRELQVATGLGIYSLVSLTAAMLQMRLTTASQAHFLFLLVIGGSLCCMMYWAFSFAQKEAERRAFTPQMQSLLLAVAGAARSTRVALADSQASKPRRPE